MFIQYHKVMINRLLTLKHVKLFQTYEYRFLAEQRGLAAMTANKEMGISVVNIHRRLVR